MNEREYSQCVICGNIISSGGQQKHEHHFPIIEDLGGKDTITVCRTCHTMIHKTPIEQFPVECLSWYLGLFSEYEERGRWEKLMIAKFFYIMQNIQRFKEKDPKGFNGIFKDIKILNNRGEQLDELV